MAKLNETKIPITEFLDAYRRQPCLYNSHLDTYKNRVVREEAYEAIIRSLKIPQLTVLDIKLKIKSVRTVYTKELRILMREREQGRCYEPKLFWFKRADSFLRSVSLSHCKHTKNKHVDVETIKKEDVPKILLNGATELIEDALQREEDERSVHLDVSYVKDVEHEEHGAKPNVGTNSSSQAPNKTELIIDDAVSSLSRIEQQQLAAAHHAVQQQTAQLAARKLKYIPYPGANQIQSQRNLSTPFASPSPSHQMDNNGTLAVNSDDDLNIFGQSIACQLRSIPDPYSRSVAKLRIQQVLFEAETGQSSEAVNPHLHSF